MAVAVPDEKSEQPATSPNGVQDGLVVTDDTLSNASGQKAEKKPEEGVPVSCQCLDHITVACCAAVCEVNNR